MDKAAEQSTQIVLKLREGDRSDVNELMDLVYDRLKEAAARMMTRERAGHTMQPTALVHEAYMKLVDQSRVDWQGKSHFCAVAVVAMKRLLIDSARSTKAKKRGGGAKVQIGFDDPAVADRTVDCVALNETLEELRRLSPRQADVVEMRAFGGMTTDDVACALRVSKRTVSSDWAKGQAFVRHRLSED